MKNEKAIIPLPKIIFKQNGLVIVDKPSGYTVHNEEPSVQAWAKKELGVKEVFFPLRLDRETSGLQPILMAPEGVEKFRQSCTRKAYYAILRGQLEEREGLWSWPISDKAEGRKNPLGKVADRVGSQTHYKVTQSNRYFSLVECILDTGRQHQIRKHAAHAGHAIVGDSRYGDEKYNHKMSLHYGLDRLLLHCYQLNFHWGPEPYSVEAQMPDLFQKIIVSSSLEKSST